MAAIWIWLCAYLNCAGWILSALHALNRTGYAIVLAVGIGCLLIWRARIGPPVWPRFQPRKLRRRFSRFFPAAFLVVTMLVILGGVLHAPSNYDALAYRMPRILHWLAAEQWHWIHTDFQRLNARAVGYEWVATPILLFTHSLRPVFLIGAVSFLLLPGLVFSLFTRLGVRPRVAWHWMWIAPTGYCFSLQAGGIGNDIFGAVFALAAFDFALRTRRSGKFQDAILACLAAGLLTGAKASNIPLVLPGALALLPCWRLFFARPLTTLATAAAALLISFLPSALMNMKHCGDWTGTRAEQYAYIGPPSVTIPGNVIILTLQNFAPPVFPMASRWNAVAPGLMPAEFRGRMKQTFEPSGANLALSELQNEEFAGLGFGVSMLVVVSGVAGGWSVHHRAAGSAGAIKNAGQQWLRFAPWLAALGYCAKATIGTAARIFTPYYLLLLPALLASPGQVSVCRSRWWRFCAACVFGLAAVLVIVTPSRPLWPAQTILSALVSSHPGNQSLQRALTVYSVYSIRADGLAPVRERLPADALTVGLVTFDDLETSLWRPFGKRRFVHIVPGDTREDLLRQGIEYVVLNGEWFPGHEGMTVEDWVQRFGGTIEATVPLRLRAGRETFNWHIVRLK